MYQLKNQPISQPIYQPENQRIYNSKYYYVINKFLKFIAQPIRLHSFNKKLS
ncbi:hypothetical protein AB0756_39785 [Tolypothrix campylonemoides VB511288_2]|uniref:Uncharacterized protein n=1 Tax=Tolypothrix campylonemoides VB511288_2 TaxID=3232311 RepID=A0ABW8XPU3_9CYAN